MPEGDEAQEDLMYGHLMEGVKVMISSEWCPVAGPEVMGAIGMQEILSKCKKKMFFTPRAVKLWTRLPQELIRVCPWR